MRTKEQSIRVVVVPVGESPRVETIANTLAGFRAVVGGYIECVPIAAGVHIVCNDEGMSLNLPANRCGILGPFLVSVLDVEGDNRSLTDDELARALAWLERYKSVEHPGDGFTILSGPEALGHLIERAERAALARRDWEGLIP